MFFDDTTIQIIHPNIANFRIPRESNLDVLIGRRRVLKQGNMFENNTKIIPMLLCIENAADFHGIKSNRPLRFRNKKYIYIDHHGKYIERVSNELLTRKK